MLHLKARLCLLFRYSRDTTNEYCGGISRILEKSATQMAMVAVMSSNYISSRFVHPLLRARDWQDRLQLAAVCHWWRAGGSGVCALIGTHPGCAGRFCLHSEAAGGSGGLLPTTAVRRRPAHLLEREDALCEPFPRDARIAPVRFSCGLHTLVSDPGVR